MVKKIMVCIGIISSTLIGMNHPLDPQRMAHLRKAFSKKEETDYEREKREKAERLNLLSKQCTAQGRKPSQLRTSYHASQSEPEKKRGLLQRLCCIQ